MDYGTSSYVQETPRWLWRPWTAGPAEPYDRFDQRITQLLALDALANCPETLSARERARAETLVEDLELEGFVEVVDDGL